MQVYVQNCTRTTFPCSSAVASGGELSQPVAPSKPGSGPSSDSEPGAAWRREPNKLISASIREVGLDEGVGPAGALSGRGSGNGLQDHVGHGLRLRDHDHV